jgi:hypothetical protein
MKRLLTAIALAAASITPPALAAEIGVSISIGQPGFYGQIEPGNYGRPSLVYSRPITIERARYGASREPLYLRVPVGHSRNWKRYCSGYSACGRPVYFVRDDWYNNVYAPRYRDDHRGDGRDNDDRNDRNDRDDRDSNRRSGR